MSDLPYCQPSATTLRELIRCMRAAAYKAGTHHDNPRHPAHAEYHVALGTLIDHLDRSGL